MLELVFMNYNLVCYRCPDSKLSPIKISTDRGWISPLRLVPHYLKYSVRLCLVLPLPGTYRRWLISNELTHIGIITLDLLDIDSDITHPEEGLEVSDLVSLTQIVTLTSSTIGRESKMPQNHKYVTYFLAPLLDAVAEESPVIPSKGLLALVL